MARRVTPSQYRARARRAVQDYNRKVRRHNAEVQRRSRKRKQAVDEYNRNAHRHNAAVNANRRRINSELRKLSYQPPTTLYVQYQTSVTALQNSFARVESDVDAERWEHGQELLDMVAGETANSVAVLSALATAETATDEVPAELTESRIDEPLLAISADLHARWQGALFSLNPRNPDAARHFCTSAREMIASILDAHAPSDDVFALLPDAPVTKSGTPTRRAKVQYCLTKTGYVNTSLEEFIDDDIDNVVTLFRDFNKATHGTAGRFDTLTLLAIKRRVEDAVLFLHAVLQYRGPITR